MPERPPIDTRPTPPERTIALGGCPFLLHTVRVLTPVPAAVLKSVDLLGYSPLKPMLDVRQIAYRLCNAPAGAVGATLALISAIGFWLGIGGRLLLHASDETLSVGGTGYLVVGSVVGTLFSTLLCVGSILFEREKLAGLAGLIALGVLENYFWPINLMDSLLLVFSWPGTVVVIFLIGVLFVAVQKLAARCNPRKGCTPQHSAPS